MGVHEQGRGEIERVVERALALSKADATEVLFSANDLALTRYTDNSIHENLRERNRELRVRAVFGTRVGVAGTNRVDDDGIAAVVERAAAIARIAAPNPDFVGLPSDDRPTPQSPGTFDEATAEASAADRAAAVAAIVEPMRPHKFSAAGYVSTSSGTVAVANSHGIRRIARQTDSGVNVKAIGPSSSGYGEGYASRFADLDAGKIAARAAAKAAASTDPGAIEPGSYAVIMEPPAFAEFLRYLSFIGFGAQSFDEGSSFMSGRIGERVVGENVSMRDDWRHPLALGLPFDFEGVVRQPVTLIENGIARDVVYDAQYAAKLHHENTGHALPAPNTDGPIPLNVVVSPGDKSLDELIASTARGVLVTRTWYIRLVDQKRTIITGMTRDGLFEVVDGKVMRGLKNMRFNESIVGALGKCQLAKDLVRSDGHVIPAVKFEEFRFSSGTEF